MKGITNSSQEVSSSVLPNFQKDGEKPFHSSVVKGKK
jgi:hypothetical protein